MACALWKKTVLYDFDGGLDWTGPDCQRVHDRCDLKNDIPTSWLLLRGACVAGEHACLGVSAASVDGPQCHIS
jgi:hypothetical protein